MNRAASARPVRFCSDAALDYVASRRAFRPGETLTFDEPYRVAHLPLVAPGHPAAIREVPDQDYRDGKYDRPRYSLVAPVPSQALTASPAFQAMEREMRAAPFAAKIAWSLCERRAAKLHATLMHRVPFSNAERLAASVREAIARLGPLSFRLGGPFLGRKNTGRIYFPVYPQEIGGEDSFALIQDAAGAPRTRFYVVGYYNLADELDAAETGALAAFIARWGEITLAEIPLTALVVHATNDDLALSGRPQISVDVRENPTLEIRS